MHGTHVCVCVCVCQDARDLAMSMQARGEGRVLDQFGNPDNPLAHLRTTGKGALHTHTHTHRERERERETHRRHMHAHAQTHTHRHTDTHTHTHTHTEDTNTHSLTHLRTMSEDGRHICRASMSVCVCVCVCVCTGPELWEQTGGRITHFVASMGTTGTIMGTSAYLKLMVRDGYRDHAARSSIPNVPCVLLQLQPALFSFPLRTKPLLACCCTPRNSAHSDNRPWVSLARRALTSKSWVSSLSQVHRYRAYAGGRPSTFRPSSRSVTLLIPVCVCVCVCVCANEPRCSKWSTLQTSFTAQHRLHGGHCVACHDVPRFVTYVQSWRVDKVMDISQREAEQTMRYVKTLCPV